MIGETVTQKFLNNWFYFDEQLSKISN